MMWEEQQSKQLVELQLLSLPSFVIVNKFPNISQLHLPQMSSGNYTNV